jgi:protein TonB
MFATVTGNPDAPRREGLLAGGATATLYLAVLTLLAAAGSWRREEIADPEPSDPIPPIRVFVEPPAERTSSGGGGGAPGFSAVKRNPPRLVEPREIPATIAALSDLEAATDDGKDLEFDDMEPAGDPLGQKEGSGTGGPGKEASMGGEGLFQPGGDVKAPALIYRVDPLYPELARKLRQEGLVTLAAIISADGTVEELRLVGSAFPLLDEAALAAVSRWRYRPGTLNGRPVRVILTVTASFRLH